MSEYELRGASADKPDVHRAIRGADPGLFPGAFCKIVPDSIAGSPEHCVALHADGAGTKAAVAYLRFRQDGDARIFRGIAQDSLVMNLDDLLCVGTTGPFVLSNTIGRNAKLIPGDVIREIIAGYESVASMLSQYHISIASCGGETADLGDLVRTIVIDSTLAVRFPRSEVIDCSRAQPGHVIVGLASFGKAAYEDNENSGIGTNGFTTARHVLLSARYGQDFRETHAPEIEAWAYQGRFELSDKMPDGKMTVGEALLSPTRTYAPIVNEMFETLRPSISAIFHNSGGGLTKCLKFGAGVTYIKDNLFPTPPIFSLIRSEDHLTFEEMCRTFNMGHRLEIICDPSAAAEIIAISEEFGVAGQVIGRVEKSQGPNRIKISDGEDVAEFTESRSS
jgi:phosphoribosylformylglycinamidine cyclo-ligase